MHRPFWYMLHVNILQMPGSRNFVAYYNTVMPVTLIPRATADLKTYMGVSISIVPESDALQQHARLAGESLAQEC